MANNDKISLGADVFDKASHSFIPKGSSLFKGDDGKYYIKHAVSLLSGTLGIWYST